MDWLEEKAKRLEAYMKNASLAKSLFFYMAEGCAAGLLIWVFLGNLCGIWYRVLAGETVAEGWNMWKERQFYMYPDITTILLYLYRFGQYPLVLAACLIAGREFLQRKLRPALKAMQSAMDYIEAGDYGQEITYLADDEMGALCRGFEQLRKRLASEKADKWANEEIQRRINTAFAHDIRTPLTVISGCTEFLQRYVPRGKVSEEELLQKLSVMQYQQRRLLRFSQTMPKLLKEEAREARGKWISGADFAENLARVAKELAGQKGIVCAVSIGKIPSNFFADTELIEEVFDNLVSNALRYAAGRIAVEMCCEGRKFMIFVADDGKGFSDRALRHATEPYFGEDKECGEHFGIGLFICRMLCEKHGGSLRLVNSIEGGAIASAEFLIVVPVSDAFASYF